MAVLAYQTTRYFIPEDTKSHAHSHENLKSKVIFFSPKYLSWGTRWRIWLRHYATSPKVEDSIPDGVIRNFQLHKPSGRTMTLGSIEPLTEMSTKNISEG
jgi:hypothetical protein